VSESCRTGISVWSNPSVDWTNAVAFRCTWERLGALATRLGAPTTSLGAPGSADEKPGSTSNHCRQSGRNNIFFGNTAGAPGNHSYYLSFNDF